MIFKDPKTGLKQEVQPNETVKISILTNLGWVEEKPKPVEAPPPQKKDRSKAEP